MSCIAEDELQTIYDAHDYYMEMESKFEREQKQALNIAFVVG